jgi:hypothetical protein
MSRPSTGMTNAIWLTVSGDVGCERRTWRDYGCEIALTPCRLIEKRSHSREGTSSTITWRPNSGWSVKISPILSLDSCLSANVERCPRDRRRSARLASGFRGSWILSCQAVSGTPASRLPLPSKQTAPGHRCYEGRFFWPVHELLPSSRQCRY